MSAWARAREMSDVLARAGIEDPALEAELLVRHAAGLSRVEYFKREPVPPVREIALENALARRLAGEPNAYITGSREFFGRQFHVGPDVLIPRPETEMLVELVLAEQIPAGAIVADIGTGSGCIAVSVAAERPDFRVVGVDVSASALCIARGNAVVNSTTVSFIRGNLSHGLARADVILANLPYIPAGDIATLQPEVRDWEPRLALDGGPDGLSLIRELVLDCATRLRPRLLALEVGLGQAERVASLLREYSDTPKLRNSVTVLADFAGIPRVVLARW